LFTTNPTWPDPGRPGVKPATNCISLGTAYYMDLCKVWSFHGEYALTVSDPDERDLWKVFSLTFSWLIAIDDFGPRNGLHYHFASVVWTKSWAINLISTALVKLLARSPTL
jgi:hypothetical protein